MAPVLSVRKRVGDGGVLSRPGIDTVCPYQRNGEEIPAPLNASFQRSARNAFPFDQMVFVCGVTRRKVKPMTTNEEDLLNTSLWVC
jgi:hypothetical protein